MMNKVAISAVGRTQFSKESPQIEDVMFDAVSDLYRGNCNVDKNIDVVLVSTNDNTKYLGAILSERAGIRPRTSHNVESMCSSGTSAIVSAYSYIASGLARSALVVGADRFDGPGQVLQWDKSRGEFAHPVFWASIFARAYKTGFGVSAQDLAVIAVKNRQNARDNPGAIPQKTPSIEDVLSSRYLTDDLRLLECSMPSTGSCAVLLTSEEVTPHITDAPVWIDGIGQKTTSAGFAGTSDFTRMQSTAEAARQAFEMSGYGAEKIDVAEVHDAFTVCEALAIEDIGIAKKGHGAEFAKEMYETQNKMINPRGGLIGAGHPLGATGIAQVIEVTEQLQGRAGPRQVQGAKSGLVHNMSAAATSSTVLVVSS